MYNIPFWKGSNIYITIPKCVIRISPMPLLIANHFWPTETAVFCDSSHTGDGWEGSTHVRAGRLHSKRLTVSLFCWWVMGTVFFFTHLCFLDLGHGQCISCSVQEEPEGRSSIYTVLMSVWAMPPGWGNQAGRGRGAICPISLNALWFRSGS